MRAAALLLLGVLVAGCGASSGEPVELPPGPVPDTTSGVATPLPSTPTRTPTSSAPTTQPTPEQRFSSWELGSIVLPLRADGYGEVRPTPPSLRNRRYPTVDLLPPPVDGDWASTVGPITRAVRERLTWEPGCPVALGDLRYLTVSFLGFDGAAHTGELVVAASEADDVVSVFRALFRADYPIEEMRIPEPWELDAPPTGDGNNTAAYVCRPSTGQTSGWSAHAYGLAIDLNPFVNPYVKGDLVLPELASSYLDRARVRPGMLLPDSLAVREFARIGWSWGGDWNSLKDYQHFSATGL